MSKLLLKYPTRGRPELFKSTFGKYRDMLSGNHEYEFVVSLDEDDSTMNTDAMRAWLASQPNTHFHFGKATGKIAAINADMKGLSFDVLLLVSDDMIPILHGYDDVIFTEMVRNFPAMDGALHFNDGRTGKELNTLSIMGKSLFDKFGYIYHPAYLSLWCDNEFTDVTTAARKVAYINQTIISHEWVRATGKDALHQHNESFYDLDKQTYLARKAMEFPR